MKPGIYIHLPFCSVHCSYCDFPLTTRLSLADDYYRSLLREIAMRARHCNADSLYFGGGTPSLTPAEVLGKIRERFPLEPGAEITLEANPENVTAEKLDSWKDVGINRLSIGVQSLEERVLKGMLRTHSPQQSIEAFERARAGGFHNINMDLMIGAPGQSVSGFFDGLRTLIELGPAHFSIYLLEIHENTALWKQIESGRVRPMSEDEQLQCYTGAVEELQTHGYEHYEVSNFALRGYVSRHNIKYWTNTPYAGFGAGACSYWDHVRTTNLRSVSAYIAAVNKGELPEEISAAEDHETQMRNAVIFGLRKRQGIDLDEFHEAYGVSALTLFDQADEYMRSGFLEVSENHLRLTLRGMLVSNEILASVL